MSIYIYTHKDFDLKVHNTEYKILTESELYSEYNIEVINIFDDKKSMNFLASYGELKGLFFLLNKNISDKFIGLVQYRRYFNFYDDIPNFDSILNENSIIVPEKQVFTETVYEQYKGCHFIRDYILACDILERKFPYYKHVIEDVSNQKWMYDCNMFIMTNKMFHNYMTWLNAIFDEFNETLGFYCFDDVQTYVHKHSEDYNNRNEEYQCRLHGFLSERLMNFFIKYNFENIIEYKVDKY